MKIIEQGYEILDLEDPGRAIRRMETIGRTCYKSEDKITDDSASKFLRMLRDRGHHAMLEFGVMTVRFITNRGVTHEEVRHRLSSFAQESTRYVNYGGKDDIEFIRPVWFSPDYSGQIFRRDPTAKDKRSRHYFIHTMEDPMDEDSLVINHIPKQDAIWVYSCLDSEDDYNDLIAGGWRPEQAREVLPNSLKTEICHMANYREWRHIFQFRTSNAAHPQMRALMRPLLDEVKGYLPELFEDINYGE